MKGSRVFVTGGAGVIGLELVPRLVAKGAKVLVGDLKPKPSSFPDSVRYRQGDLNDMQPLEFEAFAPQIMIHLAATFERSTETQGFWDENFANNVRLSHYLLSMARDCGSLRRVVFASSYLIYDPALYQFNAPPASPVRLAESDAIRPRNLTGMAKASHEMELQFLSSFDTCHFSTLAVRIFRGYGRNSRDVISRWIRALLADESIAVYRPEGTFDYIYAADSAEGLVRLTVADDATGVVNLGTGRARQVTDVVSVLKNYFPSARIHAAESAIPVEASEADTRRLRDLINWEPEMDLEEAIPEIIDYERAKLRVCQNTPTQVRHVLVTSASRKAPLLRAAKDAISRIDPRARVVAGDLDVEAPAQYVADDFWVMPPTGEASLNALLEGCLSRDIGVVLPSRDAELSFWAHHREAFSEVGVNVVISSPESVNRCIDKLTFARFGSEAGLPVIPSAETIKEVAEGPYVVKERFGSGSRGIGLNLNKEQAVDHARSLTRPIFQPYIEGPEFSIDGWLDADGRAVGVILRSRDRVSGGESQVTTTVRSPEVEDQACAILERLDLRGPVVMQAIVNAEGMHIIEVNPRFGGASTLAVAAGLDSIYWSLAEALGCPEKPAFQPAERQLRQVRLPGDTIISDHHF